MAADDWIDWGGFDDWQPDGPQAEDEPIVFEDAVCLRATERALQVCVRGGDVWWIPRSVLVGLGEREQVPPMSDMRWPDVRREVRQVGDRGPIGIASWWVDQKERADGEEEGA